MAHLVIIGGSDAGISAALRARELDSAVEITLILADSYPNFSICGLPFFLSGEVSDWRTLAHRTKADIEQAGIRILLNHRAGAIDAERKIVQVVGAEGQTSELPYDRLVIATGAESIKPDIEGIDLPGVFVLRWMDDSFAVQQVARRTQAAISPHRGRRLHWNGDGRRSVSSRSFGDCCRVCRKRSHHR